MFKVVYSPNYWGYICTVYAVDFNHDAFLIAMDGKFKWVNMEKCRLYEGEEPNGAKV